MLKNEINRLLSEIVETGEYRTLRELRTFRKPGRSVEEILAERCWDVARDKPFQKELAEALKEVL